jgi:uncharacterized protein (TIGR03435 family)
MLRVTTIAFLLAAFAFAQTADNPSFTVADVKLSKPGTINSGSQFVPGGKYLARGVTMLNMISDAYGVEAEMIVGGPNWLDSARYDITTKAPPATDDVTAKLMLRSLLAERFKLVIHKDQKAMPSYALSVSKRGLKLKESAAPGPQNCDGSGGGAKDITMTCQHMTIADLAQQLRQNARGYVDQPVVDMTGLKGTYDYTLSWTPKGLLRKPGESEGDKPAGTSLFDAVERQLGLKLELQKQPVPVIVIDKVTEKPTDNPPEVTSKLQKEPTEFEVADIHPSAPNTKTDAQFLPGGRIDVKAVTMEFLLTQAYNVDKEMIVGPKWFTVDKFDIVAKAPVDLTPEVAMTMLKNLLADRFKLKAHMEDQPVPVYALTVSKRGLKMKESTGETRSGCKSTAGDGKRNYTCQNTTMAQLAEKLRQQAPAYVDHPVVDLTGLKGAYDFVLSWTPKQQFQNGGRGGDAAVTPGASGASDPNGDLTVSEALERQLGIKMEATKHPLPVVVVDHVEQKPTEN